MQTSMLPMLNDDVDLTNAILFADSNRGQFIPTYFAQTVLPTVIVPGTVSADDMGILLAGPDADGYWDAWTAVLDRVLIDVPNKAGDGFVRHALHQDGDLWLVPVDFE